MISSIPLHPVAKSAKKTLKNTKPLKVDIRGNQQKMMLQNLANDDSGHHVFGDKPFGDDTIDKHPKPDCMDFW